MRGSKRPFGVPPVMAILAVTLLALVLGLPISARALTLESDLALTLTDGGEPVEGVNYSLSGSTLTLMGTRPLTLAGTSSSTDIVVDEGFSGCTLTLDGVSLDAPADAETLVQVEKNLVLRLVGPNRLAGAPGANVLSAPVGEVRFTGSGSLEAIVSGEATGVSASTITIGDDSSSPSVTSTASAAGTLFMVSGTLTAQSATPNQHAIEATNVAILGGRVDAAVTNTSAGAGHAIYGSNEVVVKGGTVSASVTNGSLANFSPSNAISGARSVTITGGTVDATIKNVGIGTGIAITSGLGGISIGTRGSTSRTSPSVTASVVGGGYSNAVSSASVAIHSGSLTATADTITPQSYALNANGLEMDGGVLDATALGRAQYAISGSVANVSNATGQGGSGPLITAQGTVGGITDTLNLTASVKGTAAFYPWIVQAGDDSQSAMVLSFAGAANSTATDHAQVSSAGRWVRIQPAPIQAFAFAASGAAAPGSTVDLVPYVRFPADLQPPAKFGANLASISDLVTLAAGSAAVTVTPPENVGAVAPDGSGGVLLTLADDATGRATTVAPALAPSFAGSSGTLGTIYGTAIPPCEPLSLSMAYPVSFDANGGAFPSPAPTVVTGPNGLVDASSVPSPTRPGHVFAGWTTAPDGTEPVDLRTTAFDRATTLYALWHSGELSLVALPASQAPGGAVRLTVGRGPGVELGELSWRVSNPDATSQAPSPAPVEGLEDVFAWTVPTDAPVTSTYEITVTSSALGRSAMAEVEVLPGRVVTFDGNGGEPSVQQVIVDPGGSIDPSEVSEPTADRQFFLGWYRRSGNVWERVDDLASLQAAGGETLTAQWARVTVDTTPKAVPLEPGEDAASFTATITVTPNEPGVSLYRNFSAGAGSLETRGVGATTTPLTYSTFVYDLAPDDEAANAGQIVASFGATLDEGVAEARVSIWGAGVEFHNSVATIGSGGEVETFPVTLEGNGGTWEGVGSREVEVSSGSTIAVPEGLVRPGHVLCGWYLQDGETGGWQPVDVSTYRPEGPVTLVAHWGAPTIELAPETATVMPGAAVGYAATIGVVPEEPGIVVMPWSDLALSGECLKVATTPACAVSGVQVEGRLLRFSVTAPMTTGPVEVEASYDGSSAAHATFTVADVVEVYRLWNPYDGAHLITSDRNEYATLQGYGWVPEGVRFYQLASGGVPIYRLYNPYNGDHLYTTLREEYATLQTFGWRGEGVKLHGSTSSLHPVYRLWNSLQTANEGLGSHLWTADANEYRTLPSIEPVGAWRQEGVAWFAEGLPPN